MIAHVLKDQKPRGTAHRAPARGTLCGKFGAFDMDLEAARAGVASNWERFKSVQLTPCRVCLDLLERGTEGQENDTEASYQGNRIL